MAVSSPFVTDTRASAASSQGIRRLRLPWAVIIAAIGGYLLDIATPTIAWWPAAFIGTALVLVALWQQRPGAGVIVGLVAGAAFWFPHISWLTLYLGPIPWLALGTVMTAWFGLFGLAGAAATRGLAQLRDTRWSGTLVVACQVAATTGLWVLREQVQSVWPYGGFAWGRLAHTQAESPFAPLASWVGFSGLSAFVVLSAAVVPVLAFRSIERGARRRARSLVIGAVVVAGVCAAALVPPAQLETTGSLRVAAVQGNSKSGIFDDRDSGDVLDDHVAATEQLIEDLAAAGETVDVIVWPENSAEFNITENDFAGLRLSRLSRLANAPIVIGSVLPREGGEYTNSSLVWGPEGALTDADGAALEYDKRYPVPFAEYMPHRDFYHALVPELVDLVQLEYSAGELPAAVPIPLGSGSVDAGLAICFDIVFDGQAVAMVDDGAEVIFAQTNNADFGRTDESAQQLQIAHLRAIETGRALVNISTVGTSAVVLPDGTTIDRLTPFTSDALLAEVPLVTGETPALKYGALIAGALIALGISGCLAGIAAPILVRRSATGSATVD